MVDTLIYKNANHTTNRRENHRLFGGRARSVEDLRNTTKQRVRCELFDAHKTRCAHPEHRPIRAARRQVLENFKSINETCIAGSGRPRSACTEDNINRVLELASSQEGQRGHCSEREIVAHLAFEENAASKTSVHRMLKEHSRKKSVQRVEVHRLSEARRPSRAHIASVDDTLCRIGNFLLNF